ncbi:MAG: N-acetylmuramoyl-L-alanine amidase [Chitinophagales bacterium]|nr:N-acetylmuramoyl-L-alanine amidase [Chitinophagales bacterium]
MRQIDYIVVHCTATPQSATVSSMQRYWHAELGWKMPGYHYIIKADGQVVSLLPVSQVSNGVKGYNSKSINVAYIGGVDNTGKAIDNRTTAQKNSLINLLTELKGNYPHAIIQGHRDFPGVKKDCPSFNAKAEYMTL